MIWDMVDSVPHNIMNINKLDENKASKKFTELNEIN